MGKKLNTKNNNTLITFILFMAVTLLCALPALAGDFKRYAGANAVRTGGTVNPSYSFGSISNPGNGNLKLTLPVVNDEGNGIESGSIRVVDRNPNKDISCKFWSLYRSAFTMHGWWSPAKSSSGSSIAPQTLHFPAVKGINLTHYFYDCTIPPKHNIFSSSIVSYSAIEK